jgi:hypothetical protein
VPFVAYVRAADDDPRPEGPRPWQPDWRVWRWLIAAVPVVYAATRSDGTVELVLVLVVFALACRAAVEALPGGDGLREWRQ